MLSFPTLASHKKNPGGIVETCTARTLYLYAAYSGRSARERPGGGLRLVGADRERQGRDAREKVSQVLSEDVLDETADKHTCRAGMPKGRGGLSEVDAPAERPGRLGGGQQRAAGSSEVRLPTCEHP